MIKRIVHIDQNFPRRLSEQDIEGKSLDSKNWGFDTEATDIDDIDGAITTSGAGAIISSEVSQSTLVDQNYDNTNNDDRAIALPFQYDNLVAANGQIRFNANVFNYIVHAEIDNIILKYDAAVAYAEGKEDKYTHEYTWKQKRTVFEGHDYNITFDILLHDPMGIDADCYEAWVRGTPFCVIDRKNTQPNDVHKKQQVPYAVYTSENHVEKGPQYPKIDKWIIAERTVSKLRDPYHGEEEDETSFKLSIKLTGQGYGTEHINTSEDDYNAWKEVIDNPDSTEEEITKAWEKCEGVKFKFFDVAGNITYWVMPYTEISIVTMDDLRNLKKLILDFINTSPADLQLETDLIGRTTIKVTNTNQKLSDCEILIELDKESLGELYQNTRDESYISAHGTHVAKIVTEDVGNVDESGWIIAYAMLDIEDFEGDDFLESMRLMVRNITRAEGSLGEWIKECSDNLRKITLDPFVPQYLKETTNKNSAYYKFVKFTERYLNTMFKAYDKNCYISVLEAIARIGNFNDYTTIYSNLLDKYDDDHGDMLHITSNELAALIDVEKQDEEDEV